jgi:hypothetical protein
MNEVGILCILPIRIRLFCAWRHGERAREQNGVRMPAKNHIDLVVKTLKVLESLAESENGKALKEIAQEVGLVKSSVFRILFKL